jgi:serine phosphatase RsbU (regulator of sigma subunit)
MSTNFGARSLTAKMSYLMTGVVMMTVVALTVQSASKFSAYILQTIEESSNAMAERTASDVSTTIESWISQMAMTATKLSNQSSDATKNDPELDLILRNDKDLRGVGLYKIEGNQSTLMKRSIQSLNSSESSSSVMLKTDDLKRQMDSISEEIANKPSIMKDGRLFRNLTPSVKSPVFSISIRFQIPGQADKFAVMTLIGSMTRLQVSLPQSRYTSGYIIDGEGRVFASSDENEMLSKEPVRGNALVEKALALKSPSGFMSDFRDTENRRKIGSYAQAVGRIPLFIVIERDRAAAFQVITRMYSTSALWGLLILLLAGMISFVSAGTVTRHLRDLVAATRRIAQGDFGVRLEPTSKDEVSELGYSVNNMARKIEALMSSEVEKARFEKELETARMVQSTFFPKKDVHVKNLSVTGNYQPATQCGGDLWGHFNVSEGVELIFIADAMGHGAPAALVTAIAYATCQSVASILKEKSSINTSPAALLTRLNDIILDAVDGKISMTFFVAIFDFNTGKLTFSNAGHNFPLILTGDKNDSRLGKAAKKSFETAPNAAISLTLQGTPLGVDRHAEFKEKSIDIAAGDKLFFFTDGLIENYLPGQNPMGRKDLIEFICQHGSTPIDGLKQLVLKMGTDIFGPDNLQDDVTIVIAEISPSWAKNSLQNGPPTIPSIDFSSEAYNTPPVPSLTSAGDLAQPLGDTPTAVAEIHSLSLFEEDSKDPNSTEDPESQLLITKLPQSS